MNKSQAKVFLTIIFFFSFLDFSLAQGHESVMREAAIRFMIIQAVTSLTIISFFLLAIFRNRYLGIVSIVSGIALIIVCTDKICRYLISDNIAEWCISFAYLQIPFSFILGWIYPKQPKSSAVRTAEEIAQAKNNRRESVVKFVFIFNILMSIYGSIRFYSSADIDPSLTLIIILNACSFIFTIAATYLFFTRMQAGWIMGAAWLFSITMTIITNICFTIRNTFIYPIQLSPFVIIFSVINLSCYIICLFFICSASLRETFRVQRKQVTVAIIVGLVWAALAFYEQILAAGVRANIYMKERMEERY